MKNIIALSLVNLASVPALAQTCNSLWVYKPYVSCASPANGPDMSQAKPFGPAKADDTGWIGGGSNPTDACNALAARVNRTDSSRVLVGQGSPTKEESDKNWKGEVRYKYHCQVQVLEAPYANKPNKACGVESKWAAEDIGKSLAGLPGEPICLSCDNEQTVPGRLACLKVTVDQVIVNKEVAVRAEQLKAVETSIDRALQSKQAGIDETVTLNELKEKVSKAAGELH